MTKVGSDARTERDGVSLPFAVCVLALLLLCVLSDVKLVFAVCRVVSQDGTTALLKACRNGHLAVVQWLVTEAGSDATSERDDVSCRCFRSRLDCMSPAALLS